MINFSSPTPRSNIGSRCKAAIQSYLRACDRLVLIPGPCYPCAAASVAVTAFFYLNYPTLFESVLKLRRQFHASLSTHLQQHSQYHVLEPLHDTTIGMAPRVILKVLICGGGIAGNALAFWLTKLGHNVTVLEKYPGLRTTGLQ